MNVDRILAEMNAHGVQYLLIGGMNFLLRHEPVLTYDVDLWIEDTPENRRRCEGALSALEAAWGPSEAEWRPVSTYPAGWLERQSVFSLTSPHGAIDIFRQVRGLSNWKEAVRAAPAEQTADGTPYRGLSDEDMLRSQEALDEDDRRQDRIKRLREILGRER